MTRMPRGFAMVQAAESGAVVDMQPPAAQAWPLPAPRRRALLCF
ncbi:hypothetical protein [Paragemmobacter straminiformis]|nr:hypothetical protein [Gemmobacter straminiformis]